MTIQIWHDEIARFLRTGSLDQGPCWCPDCLGAEARGEAEES
jgi:hypothetical protein